MSYTILALIGIVATAIAYLVARAKAAQVGKQTLPLALPMAWLALITLVADNLMIGAGLYSYQHNSILGIYVGLMPLEDFSYPVITSLLVAALGGARDR